MKKARLKKLGRNIGRNYIIFKMVNLDIDLFLDNFVEDVEEKNTSKIDLDFQKEVEERCWEMK